MAQEVAIISDIHANLAALQAVLADIDSLGIKRVWCLGDIVGYGPQPVECWNLVKERAEHIIMGNHENALVPDGGEKFNARAKRAIDWTRQTIAAAENGEEIIQELLALPKTLEQGDIHFVHGSPRGPTEEYLLPRDARNPLKMKPQFERIQRFAFAGHTHLPGVFEEGQGFVRPEDMFLGKIYSLDDADHVKAIINVGSVGQPRDHNPDSCYVTFDGDSVVYRRVPYDVQSTRMKIYAIDMLDNVLGDRIVVGK